MNPVEKSSSDSSKTDESVRRALWIPGWYELDQPLAVGIRDRFWFYQNPPMDFPDVESFDYVFFNQMVSSANCQVRYATIAAIDHPVVGPLLRIDTDGMDYIFYPENGNEIVVNAEEQPGKIYDPSDDVSDWSLVVTLEDVSEPVADYV